MKPLFTLKNHCNRSYSAHRLSLHLAQMLGIAVVDDSGVSIARDLSKSQNVVTSDVGLGT